MTANGWLQIGAFLLAIFAVTPVIGRFMTRVFNRERTWLDPLLRPVERLTYRLTGVDEKQEMRWTEYAGALLAFSAVSMLALYVLQRVQGVLPLNPQDLPGVAPDLAFNTAASFSTNTNWQSYVGETTMTYLTQMAGLAYHNFISAAVGIALAIAFVRGIARQEQETIGNFWVDMTRALLWVLLPFCIVGALLLVSQGVVQNFRAYDVVETLDGGQSNDRTGSGGVTGDHQAVGHQWRRILQRQQRSPVREPDAALELSSDVRDLRDFRGSHLDTRRHDRLAPARLDRVGGHGISLFDGCDGRVLGRGAR